MKIITPGKLSAERVYRGTCTDCKCVFEFQRKEATYVSDQRDGDVLRIDCPACAHPVWVSPTQPVKED